VLTELEAKATNYLRHERLLTLLGDFKELYYKRNMAAIEERATALIVQAVRDGSIQGVRLGESRLRYLDGSHTLQDTARLSGGEKALVGLCLRIAVAEQALAIAQMGRPRFLILDEVLSSLDEERLEQVQQVFNEVVQRGLFEHIIMVTHLESVKQTWQGARLDVRKDVGAATSTIAFFEGSGGLTGEDTCDE
jgi:DNA repair exonuclease SbcCD ATPase subunit